MPRDRRDGRGRGQLREMAIDSAIMAAAAACGAGERAAGLTDSIALRASITAEPGTPAFPAAVREAVRAALAPPPRFPVSAGTRTEPAAGATAGEPAPDAGGRPEAMDGDQLLEAIAAGGLEDQGIGARSHGPRPGLHPRLSNEELAARGVRAAALGRDYAGEITDAEVRDARPDVVEAWQRAGRLAHLGVGRRGGPR